MWLTKVKAKIVPAIESKRGLLLAIFMALLFLVLMIPSTLKQLASPYSVVDFEITWTSARMNAILSAWNPFLSDIIFQTLIDYLFMTSYGIFFVGLVLRQRMNLKTKNSLSTIALITAILAPCCDALENAGLLWMLFFQSFSEIIPILTSIFASIKFLCLSSTIICLVIQTWLN